MLTWLLINDSPRFIGPLIYFKKSFRIEMPLRIKLLPLYMLIGHLKISLFEDSGALVVTSKPQTVLFV